MELSLHEHDGRPSFDNGYLAESGADRAMETTAVGSFLFPSNTSQLSFWAELQVVLQLDWARLMSVN